MVVIKVVEYGKKISALIGIFSIMIIAFWGTDYLLYILYIKKSKLFIPCFILFLLMMSLFSGIITKFNLANKIIASSIVFFSVFISLVILRVTLPYL